MKKLFTTIITVLLFSITIAQAELHCSKSGTTVVFVNGMNAESERKIKEQKEALDDEYKEIYPNSTNIFFDYAYNPSRGEGMDLVKSIMQSCSASNDVGDIDLLDMLNQLNERITTERIVFVGHSQGTLYANAIYNRINGKQLPTQSLGLVNIATPSHYIPGGGVYFTSSNDAVINNARSWQAVCAQQALPANTTLSYTDTDPNGHDFVDVYLEHAGAQIVRSIYDTIQRLHVDTLSRPKCIDPEILISFERTKRVGLAVGTLFVNTGYYGVKGAAYGVDAAGKTLYALTTSTMNLASSVLFYTPAQAQSSTAVLAVVPSITTPETELYHPVTFEPLPKVQPEVVPPQPVLSEEPITWEYIPERDASYIPVVAAPHTVVSTPVTGSALGGSDIPSTPALPQPIILTGGAGQGGGGSPVSEVVATASAPAVAPLVCTLPEVPSVEGTACVTPDIVCTLPEVRSAATNTCTTPDATPPSLTLHLAGCLSLQSTETTYSCVAHTDGSITASWEVEPGSTVSLDTVVTTETSSTLSGNATFVAADVAGNITTKQVIISRSRAPLLISEVGYPLSSHLLPPGVLLNHQYIELYNPTDVPIDLTSLLLESSSQSSAGTPQFSLALSGTIQPQQYFLATNALDIDGATEDMMHAWTNTIPNTGAETHQLLLKQGTITLDSFELGCPALSSVCHISGHPFALERSRRQDNGVSYAYADEQGNPRFVYTAGTKQFVGSPGKRNTADYVLAALTGVLSTEFSPYYGRTVVVPAGSTATIEAGATLTMSDGGGFGVNGILNIKGTTSSPVTISSAERWYGISVAQTGTLIAEHTQIARAGAGNSGSDRAALTNEGGSITLTDVTLTDVRPNGFFQESGMSTFTNVSFQNSDYPENAVKVRGGSFTYTGGTLTNFSDFGFHLTGTPTCTITDVTITGVRTARTSGSETICGWSGVVFNGSPL